MFLIFAVGVQFDDDVDGESYYEISQKYLNDAIDENPQETLGITRRFRFSSASISRQQNGLLHGYILVITPLVTNIY
jgi:hypothetical protein